MLRLQASRPFGRGTERPKRTLDIAKITRRTGGPDIRSTGGNRDKTGRVGDSESLCHP